MPDTLMADPSSPTHSLLQDLPTIHRAPITSPLPTLREHRSLSLLKDDSSSYCLPIRTELSPHPPRPFATLLSLISTCLTVEFWTIHNLPSFTIRRRHRIKHLILRVLGGLYLDFYGVSCWWFYAVFHYVFDIFYKQPQDRKWFT